MRANLSSCLGLIHNGQNHSTNRLLILVPHEGTHGIRAFQLSQNTTSANLAHFTPSEHEMTDSLGELYLNRGHLAEAAIVEANLAENGPRGSPHVGHLGTS